MSINDVTLHHVRVFREVALVGSFTTAARQMGWSQPSLSRTVLQLERILGVTLLHRDTRNVELTAEGTKFLGLAEQFLDSLSEGLEEFERYALAEVGVLSISTLASFASYLVPPLLSGFLRQSPGVDLYLLDGGNDEVVERLVRGVVELAIGALPIDRPHLEALPLIQERLSAVVPDSHPWVGRQSVKWTDFEGEDFVAARPGTSIRVITDHALAGAGVTVQHRLDVANIATLGGLVRSGLGVSVLPAMEFQGYRLDDLERIPIDEEDALRTLCVFTDPERPLSPTARRFLDLVPDTLKEVGLPPDIQIV